MLDLVTQGHTKKEAVEMMADAIQCLVDKKSFKVNTDHESKEDTFLVYANDTDKLIALILKRQRAKHGLSIADVANKLGFSSRNAYARYETAKVKISFNKFIDLW